LTLDEYQKLAMTTRLPTADLTYAMFGISAEVGELHGHIAKTIRDAEVYELDSAYVKKELGDILWFIAAIAADHDFTLSNIALTNLEKLKSRQERDVLGGSGDDR